MAKEKDKNAVPKLPKADYYGTLKIGEKEIKCAVLHSKSDNPIRVFVQREVVGLLTGNKKGGFERYLKPENINKHLPIKFKVGNLNESTIAFLAPNGRLAQGFIAEDLIDICKAYMDAKLKPSQAHLGIQAQIIVFAFAKTGVAGAIDEATGFQEVRMKDALNRLLNKHLLDEAKKYKVTFPIEFYKTIFRLNNWDWTPQSAQKKPIIVAKWTNDLVYERLAPGLLEELKKRNPLKNGKREHKHFQFLTDEVGEPRLREHFGGLMALGRYATNWRKFREMVNAAFPKTGDNMMLGLDFED